MYPVSFDNPNGRTRPQRAANRNVTDAVQDPRITVFPDEDRLLVVECRTDDRWRVVLCTGLEDLDDALDTVRSLRQAEGTDEVSLTIEVSGQQGRESRREVVRFGKENTAETHMGYNAQSTQAPTAPGGMGLAATEIQAMEAAFAAVSPAFKMPDISLDDMILPQDFSQDMVTPRAVNDTAERADANPAAVPESMTPETVTNDEISLSNLAWQDDVIQTHETKVTCNDIPEFLKVQVDENTLDECNGSDDNDRAEEEALTGETDNEPVLEPESHKISDSNHSFSTNRFEPRRRTPQSLINNGRHGWIDDLINSSGPLPGHDMYDDDDDDDGEFATRLESPMFARENGVTAKVLVFAGTVALLILGGALAELLAVDITTSASAHTVFLGGKLN